MAPADCAACAASSASLSACLSANAGLKSPDFTAPALPANLALADALRPVAERHGVTPAAVAVAWTLAFPGVTGAIVGARSPRQVDGWLPAASLELKDDDLADIAAAVRATGAGTGPAAPAAAEG